MELLDICLTTTHFHIEDKFSQHKDGMAVGISLPPVVTDILVLKECFEETALDIA
jgi:hypothetical protein